MQADRIAQVEIDSNVFPRFERHVRINKPISYYESTNMSDKGVYKILDAKPGFPGYVNFYLKRVDVI